MEDLIGRKVKGFKFEGDYVPQMDRHIGEVGEIISVNLKKTTIRVQFNKITWRYPADQIEKHLVKEVMTIDDLKIKGAELPNLKGTIKCRVVGWEGPDQTLNFRERVMYSFGTIMRNNVQYILAEEFHYSFSSYYMIPTTTIEKLAIEQGMITKKKELPKSFACTNTNQELWDKYIKWFNKEHNWNFAGHSSYCPYYGIDKDGVVDNRSSKHDFDTILSLEEWDEIVNGTQTKTKETMKNYTITREQLKKIHDVACFDWKEKITEYAVKNPFGDTIEFTQTEVDEMFKAASLSQTAVLANIFGKQIKELDFKSDDINFKVDGLSVFGESNKSGYDSFIGLPSTDKYKSSFFLNIDYDWTLDDGVLTVTRKK